LGFEEADDFFSIFDACHPVAATSMSALEMLPANLERHQAVHEMPSRALWVLDLRRAQQCTQRMSTDITVAASDAVHYPRYRTTVVAGRQLCIGLNSAQHWTTCRR
jgi:hypothetical protein